MTKTMKDSIEQRLEWKRDELAKKQEVLKMEVERNINTISFEANMINSLLLMAQLKAEIRELELCVQLR